MRDRGLIFGLEQSEFRAASDTMIFGLAVAIAVF